MKAEYTAEDFEKGIKNPYFEKFNTKTEIAMRREVYQIFCDIGKQNGVEPEVIMSRCLSDYAAKLQNNEEEQFENIKIN